MRFHERSNPIRCALLGVGFAMVALVGAGCTPTYPNCDNDEHCRAKGEYCVGGMCQQCRTDEHCGTCRSCNAGACQAVPGCCTHTGDCAVGQACRSGQCGPECLDTGECGAGNKCADGRCVPDVECTVDGDCPQGEACQQGRCNVVEQAPEQAACQLERVYFDFDSASISSSSARTLQADAQCLKQKGDPRIIVEGHCDDRGTEEYNLALGERRARSAKRYLEELGVSGIKVVSYGENKPLHSPPRSETDHAENRRAEIVER